MPRAASPKPAELPPFIAPQLAQLADRVPLGDSWIYEVKYDGYRCIAATRGDQARLYTRTGQDWTKRLGDVPRALAALRLAGTLIDGEICVLDAHGRSSFPALQAARGRGLVYVVFDLLVERGRDIRALPLIERKDRLRRLVEPAGSGLPLLYASHSAGDGERVFATLCAIGAEGIIAKRSDRPYVSGKGRDWRKVKCPGYRRAAISETL